MGPVFRRFTAASPLKWALAGRWGGCLAILGSHGAWLLALCWRLQQNGRSDSRAA
jgi:hypothetical protein